MIDVVIGELAQQEHEGVVCPVRSDLAPLTEASRDLLARAGDAVADTASRIGALPVGGAFVTPGGALSAFYIIHAVTASEDEPETLHSVRRALRNALRRAGDLGMESIAVPPLGLGAGRMEAEDAARSMIEVLAEHLADGGPPRRIAIVVPGPYERDVFRHFVSRLAPDSTEVGN